VAMEDTRWLTPEEDRAWRGYRRMRMLLDLQLARDLYGDSQLSEADYDVLSTVTEKPGEVWRATELAGRLLWSTSRLAHHLRRMERRGLVIRGEVPGDARGATVTLSEAGRAALRTAAIGHVESVRRHFIDLLSAAQIETLTDIAGQVIGHFADALPAPAPLGPQEPAAREAPEPA
jgi:DNA-binding MarR family transcriptional regulator